MEKSVGNSSIHLYADDTILYTAGPSPDTVLKTLQDSFQRIQSHLSALGLVLNTTETKIMWLGRSDASKTGTIVTADGRDLEIVKSYK